MKKRGYIISMNTLVCVSKIKGIKGVRYHRPSKISNVKSKDPIEKTQTALRGTWIHPIH